MTCDMFWMMHGKGPQMLVLYMTSKRSDLMIKGMTNINLMN